MGNLRGAWGVGLFYFDGIKDCIGVRIGEFSRGGGARGVGISLVFEKVKTCICGQIGKFAIGVGIGVWGFGIVGSVRLRWSFSRHVVRGHHVYRRCGLWGISPALRIFISPRSCHWLPILIQGVAENY